MIDTAGIRRRQTVLIDSRMSEEEQEELLDEVDRLRELAPGERKAMNDLTHLPKAHLPKAHRDNCGRSAKGQVSTPACRRACRCWCHKPSKRLAGELRGLAKAMEGAARRLQAQASSERNPNHYILAADVIWKAASELHQATRRIT